MTTPGHYKHSPETKRKISKGATAAWASGKRKISSKPRKTFDKLEYCRKYREDNRERISELYRKYYREHCEELKARRREYYLKTRK